ncbi:transposase [Nostoc flagelliforme]|uniref:transposase n=1 Tax=Nostoc flagelliforme TaxID=1306274 RepID=UPI0018EFC230
MTLYPCPNCCKCYSAKYLRSLGYVYQKLAKQLLESVGIQVITKLKRNMKNRFMSLSDRLLLRKPRLLRPLLTSSTNISQID